MTSGERLPMKVRSMVGLIPLYAVETLDPAIVEVTAGGLARAVAPGTARVRASFAGAADTGTVTVLPAVDIRVSGLSVVTDPAGEQGMRMRIRNDGGRGFFRLEFWRHDPDGSKRRILWYVNESEAEPGLDVEHRNFLGGELAEWVVAYSREPLSEEPVRTSCARLDGATEPCPSDVVGPPAAVDSVLLTPAAAVVYAGDTIQYIARAFADDVELPGREVVWTTPSPEVISLSATGRAIALRPGYGQVTATVEAGTPSERDGPTLGPVTPPATAGGSRCPPQVASSVLSPLASPSRCSSPAATERGRRGLDLSDRVSGEPIPDARLGDQVLRARRVGFELVAKVGQVHA